MPDPARVEEVTVTLTRVEARNLAEARRTQMGSYCSGARRLLAALTDSPDQPQPPEPCEECDGKGVVATGECRVAMSGPTCFNPDCPPCQTPEIIPCPACTPQPGDEQ